MARQRRVSNASNTSSMPDRDQELGSMYDYLAKIILLGPSGSGKSCLLHRFIRNEWRAVTSQTIGVEFASKIVRVGTGSRRQRIKLQLWDTAGTERFRSVSRSYYRGAAGAILVYDLTSRDSFQALPTFLHDARALASPNLTVLLAGNKADAADEDVTGGGGNGGGGTTSAQRHLLDDELTDKEESATRAQGRDIRGVGLTPEQIQARRRERQNPQPSSSSSSSFHPSASVSSPLASTITSATPPSLPTATSSSLTSTSISSTNTTINQSYTTSAGSRLTSTIAPAGRAISQPEATRWASTSGISVSVEVSALDGSGVDELFGRLARTILTKIELGEIDPDDPASGIQYGDGGSWGWEGGGAGGGAGGDESSMRSGKSGTSTIDGGGGGMRRRRGKGGARGKGGGSGGGGWEDVFRLDGYGGRNRGRGGGCC